MGGQFRGVQDVHSLRSLQRHQSYCKVTKEKFGTPKKTLKYISHYSMCKIKPSCDEETVYSISYPFMTTHLWSALQGLPHKFHA